MQPAESNIHTVQATMQVSLPVLEGRLLVLFDGHCGLCNRTVRWFLRRDRKDRLRFAPSESPQVASIVARYGYSALDSAFSPNTILVVRKTGTPHEKLLVRSDAVLALLAALPQPWPVVAWSLGWLPRPLRDLGYRLIARWRYSIWGRMESCPTPTEKEQTHFL